MIAANLPDWQHQQRWQQLRAQEATLRIRNVWHGYAKFGLGCMKNVRLLPLFDLLAYNLKGTHTHIHLASRQAAVHGGLLNCNAPITRAWLPSLA